MMISLHFLIILLVFGWIYFLWSRRRYYFLMMKVPGPLGYPVIGVALDVFRKKDHFRKLGQYIERYGNSFLCWLGPLPFYLVNDPQLLQDVLNSQHCVNKSAYVYDIISDLMADGIITSKKLQWSKHRKLINPAFKQNVLISFIPIFNNETKDLLKLMDSYVGTGDRNLLVDLVQFTMRIALKTSMGNDVKEESSSNGNALADSSSFMTGIFGDLIFAPWLRIEMIRKLTGLQERLDESKSVFYSFITKIIDSKLSKSTNSQKPDVFMDHALVYLKNGNFTYQNVIDETITILFGAFETTADAIFFTLTLLAMHPEYQEKLFEELQEMYTSTGDFEVTNEDIQNLNYLDRVLNESMRLIPPVPMIARQATADFKLSNGVLLPKGLNIGCSIFHLHRSEDIWGPRANIFNPDNFLPDNMREKHSYSFIPFLKGTRNCIGWRYGLMTVKIALVKLLRNYKFSTKFLYEDLQFAQGISMKLLDIPLLNWEKRSK